MSETPKQPKIPRQQPSKSKRRKSLGELSITTRSLRVFVGFLIILGHFSALIFLFSKTNLLFDEALNIAVSLAPLSSAFVMAILRDFIKNRTNFSDGERVTGTYAFVCIFFPVMLIGSMIFIISEFGARITLVETLQSAILVIETILGGFLGAIIDSLFKDGSNEKHEQAQVQDN